MNPVGIHTKDNKIALEIYTFANCLEITSNPVGFHTEHNKIALHIYESPQIILNKNIFLFECLQTNDTDDETVIIFILCVGCVNMGTICIQA